MLMNLLFKENRYDDANKAADDADFREKLFKEYGIQPIEKGLLRERDYHAQSFFRIQMRRSAATDLH